MAMIYVRTKPGRKAFFEGKVIPQDKFIPVPDNPYIRRLVHHWEDLEVEEGKGSGGRPAQSKKKEQPWISGGKSASEPPAPGTGSPVPKA